MSETCTLGAEIKWALKIWANKQNFKTVHKDRLYLCKGNSHFSSLQFLQNQCPAGWVNEDRQRSANGLERNM